MAVGIGRRQFISALGGVAVGWPFTARAQQPAMPVVGFLSPLTRSAQNDWTTAFVQRLRELGWIEGRTIAVEYRWAEGSSERFAEIAAEFVRLKVNVIGRHRTCHCGKAGNIAVMGDPVGTGLVASLARPGGNVTGLSNQSAELVGKRLEPLRQVVPNLRRLAIMANVNGPIGVIEMREGQLAAHILGLEVTPLEIRRWRQSDLVILVSALDPTASAIGARMLLADLIGDAHW